MSIRLVLAAAVVCGASGLPALLLGRASDRGQLLAAVLSAAGSALGIGSVALFLVTLVPVIVWAMLSAASPWRQP